MSNSNKTILINVANGKQIEIKMMQTLNQINAPQLVKVAPKSASVSSGFSSDDSDSSDDSSCMMPDDMIVNTTAVATGDTAAPIKKKRQRLTHLTMEEKSMRRKLKNRVAAQSARDRKKMRMDELEETLDDVQRQNAQLKSENALLKEKAQILLEENRKLLKFKLEHEKNNAGTIQFVEIPSVVSTAPIPPVIAHPTQTTGGIKRKHIPDSPLTTSTKKQHRIAPSPTTTHYTTLPTTSPFAQSPLEAEESAVFSKYASQPKSQLQVSFKHVAMSTMSTSSKSSRAVSTMQLIYALIVYTMGLLRVESAKLAFKQEGQVAKPSSRQLKLRQTLLRLVKLMHNHHEMSRQSRALKWRSTFQPTPHPNASQLALILSLTLKFLVSSRNKPKI